jgi:hypothetical protein
MTEKIFIPEFRLIICRWRGAMGFPEMEKALNDLRKAPEFQESFHRLYDLRWLKLLPLEASVMRRWLASDPIVSRRAVVTVSHQTEFLALYYALLNESESGMVRTFQDFNEGYAWVLKGAQPELQRRRAVFRAGLLKV